MIRVHAAIGNHLARKKKHCVYIFGERKHLCLTPTAHSPGCPQKHKRTKIEEPGGALAKEMLWDLSRGDLCSL